MQGEASGKRGRAGDTPALVALPLRELLSAMEARYSVYTGHTRCLMVIRGEREGYTPI